MPLESAKYANAAYMMNPGLYGIFGQDVVADPMCQDGNQAVSHYLSNEMDRQRLFADERG